MNYKENLNQTPPQSLPPSSSIYANPNSTKPWTEDKKIWYTNNFSVNKPKPSNTSHNHKRNSNHHHHHHHHHHLQNKSLTSQSSLENKNVVPTTVSTTSKAPPQAAQNKVTSDQSYQSISNQTQSIAGSSANKNTNNSIIGHYELKRTLGKGNFSTVKLAQHRITQHSVAIKVVKTSTLSEDNLMKINREIEILKKIGKQNNIVRLYQVIKTKRYFMLVTEYCTNGELYDYIVDKGRLKEPQACDYFLQILSALEYLHNHYIVHRDLKAENLLLTDDYKTVKIADFGFANYFKQDKLLSTWCGSPPYAAPELFRGLHYVGPPVDIWSLGVILYVLVCGSLPFDGHNLVFLKSRVLSGKFRVPFFMSTECEALIRGMLRLDPERRFNIRQIRFHSWTIKHSNKSAYKQAESAPPSSTSSTTTASNNDVTQNMTNVSTTIYMDTNQSSNNFSEATSSTQKTVSKVLVFDKNRGQSLDLEDDKKDLNTNNSKVEDVSMLSLNTNDEKDQNNQKHNTTLKLCKLQDAVDTDMANAVSNMSLDSNNSSLSVSQSIGSNNNSSNLTTVTLSKGTESCSAATRNLTKENSIDDQIIDFMVDHLKVAENQSSIRQSIAHDRYDDLQAIYKLIKDEPKILYDSYKSNKFKVPSLPVISLKKQMNAKKPSITTGFFNNPSAKVTPSLIGEEQHQLPQPSLAFQQPSIHDDKNILKTNQTKAPNPFATSTIVDESTSVKSNNKISEAWKDPPQLFLTPPAEVLRLCNQPNIVTANRDSDNGNENSSNGMNLTNSNQGSQFSNVARRSFDSTMQQMTDASIEIPGFSNNKLMLTNCAQQSLWDSSILDTLGVSTPSHMRNDRQVTPIDSSFQQGTNCRENSTKVIDVNNTVMNQQNIAQITTNLPQIGQLPTSLNQNILLAHLNSIALSAVATQSSVLSPSNNIENIVVTSNPIKFTPNNLVNQNYTNINVPSLPTNCQFSNLSLLNPNCINSGLERRASDGQASYKSLTNTESIQANDLSSDIIDKDNNISPNSISTSTNQVSLNLQEHMPKVIDSSVGKISSLSNQSLGFDKTSAYNQPSNSYNDTNYSQQRTILNNNIGSKLRKQEMPQVTPLDLSKTVQSSSNPPTMEFKPLSFKFTGRNHNQRSQSTTSASIVNFNQSSSPRNSTASNPYSILVHSCQTSPSTVSLTGGGPGHLVNRRKRHSLETETSRGYYCGHQHHYSRLHHKHGQFHSSFGASHQVVANQQGPNHFHFDNHDSTNSSTVHNKPQYPALSHIGQLRSFAQTFNYKKLIKNSSSPPNWSASLQSSAAPMPTLPNDANVHDIKKT